MAAIVPSPQSDRPPAFGIMRMDSSPGRLQSPLRGDSSPQLVCRSPQLACRSPLGPVRAVRSPTPRMHEHPAACHPLPPPLPVAAPPLPPLAPIPAVAPGMHQESTNGKAAADNNLKLVEGELVDYWSSSWGSWIPASIAVIDSDACTLQLDVKMGAWLPVSTPLLRQRMRPCQMQLEHIRDILCEGRVEQEASRLFKLHASAPGANQTADAGEDAVLASSTNALSKEVDQLLGTSGSIMWLRQHIQESVHQALLVDAFTSLLCKKLWALYVEFGEAVHSGYSAPRRVGEPREFYAFEKTLGEGTFGAVFLARQLGQQKQRAIKMLQKPPPGVVNTDLEQEISHLCALDHPHIVKLYEYFETQDKVFLVMDYCAGGDLQDVVNKAASNRRYISESFVSTVMQQVLKAIAHVHSRGLMHLDLKSGNVMLTVSRGTLPPAGADADCPSAIYGKQPHAMVIDLGIARIFKVGNAQQGAPCGTPTTMAPEVWRGELTPKADVWSLGVMLFELLCNSLPFEGLPNYEQVAVRYWGFTREFTKPEVSWAKIKHASSSAKQLCQKMLVFSRSQRPSAADCLRGAFVAPAAIEPSSFVSSEAAPVDGVSPAILQKISNVHLRTPLQRSVALAIARRWPANQLPSVKRAFEALDVGGTGRLAKGKLRVTLCELGLTSSHARDIVDAMDLSRDGAVDWSEFVAACIHPGSDSLEEDLHQIFDIADKDEDGLLSAENIAALLATEHLRKGDAVTDALHGLIDAKDPAARITWKQFRLYFQNANKMTLGKMERCMRKRRHKGAPELASLVLLPFADRHVQAQLSARVERTIGDAWKTLRGMLADGADEAAN